jgi:hypothetical protein
MTVAASSNPWLHHPWFDGAQNVFEGRMKQLAAKLAELITVVMLLIRC